MKRFLLSTAAGLMIAGALSLPAVAQQGYGSQQGQGQREYQSRPDDRGQPQGYQIPNQYQRQDDRNDRNYNGRGQRQASKYHDNQTRWRDNRRNSRWNDRDHNGYYIGRDWHRGQPSARDYNQRGFALGYRPWQRGDRLGSYNQRYSEIDYRDYRVQRPPQGYRWVEDDNGDLIMAALVGGLIAAIISNN
jgi:Ni/Co efflux regulator RcnB